MAIVNYRPGVRTSFGIDYEALSTKNPRLIYCENTAFGTKGPESHLPGYDIIVPGPIGSDSL